jgi:predicted ATP-binding protein involved in virulence
VGPVERVTFTQFDMTENRHRDAVRFANGSEISLQCLSDGQRVMVLSLDSDEANEVSQDTLIRQGRF